MIPKQFYAINYFFKVIDPKSEFSLILKDPFII